MFKINQKIASAQIEVKLKEKILKECASVTGKGICSKSLKKQRTIVPSKKDSFKLDDKQRRNVNGPIPIGKSVIYHGPESLEFQHLTQFIHCYKAKMNINTKEKDDGNFGQ